MKRILSTIKKNYKFGLGIVVGLIVAGTGVYAATAIAGSDVGYSNTNSKLSATTVQGAIDEIYKKSKTHCPEGYICTQLLYYEFGTPTTTSTTDYTTLGYNVFATLGIDNSLGLCINDGGLFCIKSNDYGNSVANLKAHFGEDSCTDSETYFGCESDTFRFHANSNGTISCRDIATSNNCYVDPDGIVGCSVW